MMNRGLFWLAAVAMFAVGCASGAGDPAEGDPQPVPEPEMVEPTMPPEPDPMPEPEPVPMPDPNPEPMCPVCCPGDVRCADENTAETCNDDGTAFEPTSCPEAEVCLDGACQVPPFTCEPGATTCLDTQTQETCNVDGRSVTTLQCQDGLCIGGACRVGTLTGGTCEFDDDCAGGLCLCSSVEACPVVLDEAIGEGFCTNSDCSAESCLDDELCVNYGLFGGLSDGQHCMKNCDDCTQTGFACRDVPRLDGEKTVWSEACFTEYPRGMGGECDTDADCLGGLCWTGDLNPSDGKGYCTLGCGENADCPSGSSCVDFPDLGFFCGLHCGDGTPGSGGCPVMRGLAVSCQPLSEFDTGDLKLICAPRR